MTTISHATLTGADLHEPKGAATAAAGTIYVANGSGSGAWTSSTSLSSRISGEVQGFALPIAPLGWLECDGTAISRSTYSDLFSAVTIQQTGSRSSGTTAITSLSDTSNMKVGYYIGGSGITNGTTIAAIPTSTTLTLSANATSTGSNNLIVSPWPLGNGSSTFTLPDFTTSGSFPRSRTSVIQLGTSQSNQNSAHTHGATTSTDGLHAHGYTDPGHSHGVTGGVLGGTSTAVFTSSGFGSVVPINATGISPSANTIGIAIQNNGSHFHTMTTDSNGGSETRPNAISLMYCIKI